MANYNEVLPASFQSRNTNKKRRGNHKRGGKGNRGGGNRGGGNRGGSNQRGKNNRGGGNRGSHGSHDGGLNRGNGFNQEYGTEWSNGNYENHPSGNSSPFTESNMSPIQGGSFTDDNYAPQNVSLRKEVAEIQPTSYSQISRRDTRDDVTSAQSSGIWERRSSNSTLRYTKGSPPHRRTSANPDHSQPTQTQFHIPIDPNSDEQPFKQYATRRLNDIKQLPLEMQHVAEAELRTILRTAAEKDLMVVNDWSRQRIPSLDGGGALALQCELDNGPVGILDTAYSTNVTSSNQNFGSQSHQAAESPDNVHVQGLYTQTKEPQIGKHAKEDTTDLVDQSPIYSRDKASNEYIDLTQGGVVPPHAMPYSNMHGKRLIEDDDYASNERKRQRAERFQATNSSNVSRPQPANEQNGGPIVGLNTNLEKSYLRLTSEPDPYKVRPQYILEKSVEYVFRKYSTMPKKEAFNYINDQLKSIRQDLTVQHIKNDFAISVYEQNARLSLKHNDLGEFNQCLGQLKFLYNYKRRSSFEWKRRFISLEVEMLCYKAIYMMITNNNSELCKLKLSLLQDYQGFQRDDSNVVYFGFMNSLFKLNSYKICNNCFRFFEELGKYDGIEATQLALQVISNNLNRKLRLAGLYVICGSSRTGMKIESLQGMLSFNERKDCEAFLLHHHLDTFVIKGDFQAFKAKGAVKILYKKSLRVDIKGQI